MLIKARWIIPLTSDPIENGLVRAENGLIAEIGQDPASRNEEVFDLGESVLLPGLINCHAHLEFERQDHPKDSFAAWVRSVQAGQEEAVSEEKAAEIWQQNLQRLTETGTTTVVNHCNRSPVGRVLPSRSPFELRLKERSQRDSSRHPPQVLPHIVQICEIVGSSPERAAESYKNSCEQRLSLLESDFVEETVVCPTSLYAVSPVAWESFLQNRDRSSLVSIHLKESIEEAELFDKGKGALAKLVQDRGGLLWQSDPIQWLRDKELLGPKTLLIHGNYLTEADIAALQGRSTSVIHCPGSHAYFGHQRFPLESLIEHKINIALGTDSLASNEDLSMLREMHLMHKAYPQLTFAQIVEMATLNGAKALGMEKTRGSLEAGKEADLIAVPLAENKQSPWEAIVKANAVDFTMIGGGWPATVLWRDRTRRERNGNGL